MAVSRYLCFTGAMPRYHFDLYNDEIVLDDEGRELADLDAARDVAVLEAREMMAAGAKLGSVNLGHRIEVRDRTGVVASISFADAVSVTQRSPGR